MKKPFELLRLMRPHQWVKNGFVFTGLLFGHAWHNPHLFAHVMIAFVAFCLVSSAIYTVNDIVDLEQDKQHPKKSGRPLASGQVSISAAVMLALLLATSGLFLASRVSTTVLIILVGYALMNIAYSLWLKHVVILDVFIIATGFMLRILKRRLPRIILS